MKLTIIFMLLLTGSLFAQTAIPALPTDAIFVGAGLNSSLPQQRPVGSAAYLHELSSNTYMFARYDILGITKKPYAIQTVTTAGVCQIMRQLGPVFLGECLDGGTAVSGTNIGGSIGADGLAGIRFGKKKNWGFVVMGGIVKTALSGAVSPIRLGFVYGWGK